MNEHPCSVCVERWACHVFQFISRSSGCLNIAVSEEDLFGIDPDEIDRIERMGEGPSAAQEAAYLEELDEQIGGQR